MGDRIESLLLEYLQDNRPVAYVGFEHLERSILQQPLLVVAFYGWVIIVVEVIKANDLVSSPDQFLGQVAANKPGRTGD